MNKSLRGWVFLWTAASFFTMVQGCGVKGTKQESEPSRYTCSGLPQNCLRLTAGWSWVGKTVTDMTIGDIWPFRLDDGRYRLYGGSHIDEANLRGIKSWISDDGVQFSEEGGYRLWGVGIHMPTFVRVATGTVRAYYVDQSDTYGPQPIRSAISIDGGLSFTIEAGERLSSSGSGYEAKGVGAPRVLKTKDGKFRMYYSGFSDHERILSAISADGLTFGREEGVRLNAPDYCPPVSGMGCAPVLDAAGIYHIFSKVTRCSGNWINALTGIYDLTSTDGLTFSMSQEPIVRMYYFTSEYRGNATDPALVPTDAAAVQTPNGLQVHFALYDNPQKTQASADVAFYSVINTAIK